MKVLTGEGRVVERDSKEPTAFHAIKEAHADVRNLCQRVAKVSNRLVGSLPAGTATTGGTAPQEPSGVLDALKAEAEELRVTISEALIQLDRIERALP